ncbi:sensor histidine kinase, partial [Escherichia coli]|nr:sensor histidine kinase [Escherichia coli]
DIGTMIQALLDQREARGIPDGIRIAFDRGPNVELIVLGEGARLERVFENLIENAISFSPPKSLIAISASSDEDYLTVRVEDEGPGVPD